MDNLEERRAEWTREGMAFLTDEDLKGIDNRPFNGPVALRFDLVKIEQPAPGVILTAADSFGITWRLLRITTRGLYRYKYLSSQLGFVLDSLGRIELEN
jgi:hypothetical protein